MKRGRKKNDENVIPGEHPTPIIELPKAPDHLDKVAKTVYNRIAQILAEMNILTAADGDLIAQYAELYSLGLQQSPAIMPMTHRTESGYVSVTGHYTIWRDCQKSCQKILADLGMSPASRTRVAAVVKKEVDALSEFIARNNAEED